MIESINVDVCSAGWASKSLLEPGQKAFIVKDVPRVAIELNYIIILLEAQVRPGLPRSKEQEGASHPANERRAHRGRLISDQKLDYS